MAPDRTVVRPVRLGAWHNWLSMCRQLLAESTADVILTVQDDVVFSATAMTELERLWPANTADVGFVSLYTPSHYQRKFIVKNAAGRALKHFPDHASAERYANRIRQRRRGFHVEEYRWPDGLNRVTTRSLWGACALAFPRESLRRIIEHPIAKNWQGVGKPPADPADIANVDTAIGKICNALGLGMYFVNPSLVQHVGAESTLGHGGLGGRRQALYVADDLKDAIPPTPATRSFIPTQSPQFPHCRHLGRVLGRTACMCGTTGPDVEVRECLAGHGRDIVLRDDPTTHVSACQTDNHQRPLSGKWPLPKLPSCSTCSFREQIEADVSPITRFSDTKRHLIYHIWPHNRSMNWRWNVSELLQRIELFDGTRSIAVVTDSDTSTLAEVQAAFGPTRIDHWFETPNQPLIGEPGFVLSDDGACANLGEGLSFLPLMHTLPRGPNDVAFYGHARGARYSEGDGHLDKHRRWTRMLYHSCLDDWPAVQSALTRFPMAGSFKRYDDFDLPRNHHWHYSGTFFWFRCRDVFSNSNWPRLHPAMYGQVEAWPANLFRAEETACLFGDGAKNLYHEHEIAKWEARMTR